MSALVDVTMPVVINATTSILRESPDHLRRVMLISLGWTNIPEGEYKEVFKYDYQNYCKKYTEINTKCSAYFTQADNKGLSILELGPQTGVPLEDTYNARILYLAGVPTFKSVNYYKWIYDNKWSEKNSIANPEETIEDYKNFYNFYQPGNPFNETNYEDWCNANKKNKDHVDVIREYFDLLLPKDWLDSYYNYLANTKEEFKVYLTLDTLKEYLANELNDSFNEDEYQIYLEENGSKDDDYSDKITKINDFITNNEYPCYIYLLPDGIGKDKAIGETLFATYSALQNNKYFFINYSNENLSNYESSNIFANIEGQKAAALFINNTENSDLAALTAGLFASYKFDISDSQPCSPFNYKTINGIKFKPLAQPLRQSIIQHSCNFIDKIATSTCLLNGRYGDTYPIEYRYQWDLTSFELESSLKQLIINGVNSPNYVIRYNQEGIDIIKARVKSVLEVMVSRGAVNEYAAELDPATSEMVGLSEITCINFRDYVANNPSDYENEIYGGISFYLRIGKYIRQVVMNVTLG